MAKGKTRASGRWRYLTRHHSQRRRNDAWSRHYATVAKAPNGLTVKAAKKVLSAKRAKKAVFKASKAFKVSGNASGGKITYKLAKVPKKARKYVKLSKAGKLTVKKGCPKGAYKLKVSVTQAEAPNYQGKVIRASCSRSA